MLRKVVIIGPESTGKSYLAQQLAEHFNGLCCPEYAREYLLEHGMDYSYDDLLVIARGQIRQEDSCVSQLNAQRPSTPSATESLLFIDTDMYVMKVWCEFVFGKCHKYILDQIVQRKYDLYLLCNTDLPWVKDELREYPDLERRLQLFKLYLDLLSNQSTPWVIIQGDQDNRLAMAIEAVNKIL